MSEPKLCLREGCTTPRHSKNNQYCKKHRAAYQKALRLKRSGSYVNDPDTSADKPRTGRPFRPVDANVLYFLNKINGKATE